MAPEVARIVPRSRVYPRGVVLLEPIVVAVLLGVSPENVHAGASVPELIQQVTELRDAKNYAGAAKLAADNAAREELDAASRVLLGGLSGQNFELAFKKSGRPEDLCGLAAVMRLVAPLDSPAGGAAKLVVARKAEDRLAHMLAVCGDSVPPVGRAASPTAERTPASGAPVPATIRNPESAEASSTVADGGGPARPAVGPGERPSPPPPPGVPARPAVGPGERPSPPPPPDRRARLRARAGLATLVPGLLLFAPMAGVLAYRADGERRLEALRAETRGLDPTPEQDAAAAALGGRWLATTAGAAALGAAGAALVVTGAVLLATGRPRRLSVAPWGHRGVGGLVLQGAF